MCYPVKQKGPLNKAWEGVKGHGYTMSLSSEMCQIEVTILKNMSWSIHKPILIELGDWEARSF